MGVSALTGLSVVSLLSLGYLSWDWTKPNQVESDAMSELGGEPGGPSYRPPHIIFIMTDDQGFNDIGYHSKDIRTPVLDKLAAQGVKLENYYIQPTCTPSRSQFMTGRYQIHTGLQHGIIRPQQPNCLPLDQATLAERLQQVGYSTHMVGKWHLGFYKRACLPTRRGFHSYFGSLTGSVDYYSYWACDGPAVCGFDLHEGERVAWGRSGTYSTQLYARRVRKILAAHDPNAAPLFIFLSFQAVHTPLQSPRSYIYPYHRMGNVERRKYAAMVTAVDEAVRNVTAALRKYGYYDNSVLIFSTDNGGQPLFGGNNWPLRGRKGTYWEGGVRGLGFVHSPLLRRPRRISHDLLHITDWYPTLLRIAGGNLSALTAGLDGYDAWSSISEGAPSPRQEILHNIDPLHSPASHGSLEDGWGLWDTSIQAAIRVGDWKLLTGDPGYGDWTPPQMLSSFPGSWWTLERHSAPRRSTWLFNVTADPYERRDLSEQRPDVVRQLLARLAFYNRTSVPVRYPPEDPRAQPQNNGGAWGPWAADDEKEQDWVEGAQLRGKQRKGKCKHCSMKAFFKKLNTGIMSNRI